jgi:hypothetical protein
MDPTQTLAEIRAGMSRIRANNKRASVSAAKILEHVNQLDEWMSTGGFPPEQWKRPTGRPLLTTPGPVLSEWNGHPVAHGMRKSYDHGCRCLACRAANRLRRNLSERETQEYR